MTIGAFGHNVAEGPNPDFLVLMDVFNRIPNKAPENMFVSMGMSDDFEHAVR